MVTETLADPGMLAELAAIAVMMICAGAELWHVARCRRLGRLAFGPTQRPAPWVFSAPIVRVAGIGAVTWGLITLMTLPPKVHTAAGRPDREKRHLIIALDVSPSMRLADAGPDRKQTRRKRAAEVLSSFFQRVPMEDYLISVIAVYNGAKPVVSDTNDLEVVRNILDDLPMEYAFLSGKTDLFSGLKAAAEMAHPWKPNSALLVMVTDGDSVPAVGMPKMPASIRDVVVVGVGDPRSGSFIDGRQSRQDAGTLRQTALRLNGTYHDGNEKHLATTLLSQITDMGEVSVWDRLTKREYALIACTLGALAWSLLPILLHYAGTRWNPGVKRVPIPVSVTGSASGSARFSTSQSAAS